MKEACGQKRITMIDVMRAAGADEKTCENVKTLGEIMQIVDTMDFNELKALKAVIEMLKAHENAAKELKGVTE